MAAPSPSSSTSKMEAMSREELLIHAKKQLLLLHKTKAKCDETGKKNAALETALAAKSTQLVEKLAENDELESKLSSAIEEAAKQSRKLQDLQEQLDCMKMKEETAGTTFLCLREEISSMQLQIEGFKKQVAQFDAERGESQKLLEEHRSSEVARLQLAEECAILKEERAILEERIRQADATKREQQINAEMAMVCDNVPALDHLAKLQKQNCDLQQVVIEVQSALADMQAKVENLESSESRLQVDVSQRCRNEDIVINLMDASTQCRDEDIGVDLADVATTTEEQDKSDDRCTDLVRSLLPKFEGLFNVLVKRPDCDGPSSNDEHCQLQRDIQERLAACKESDTTECLVQCLPKVGDLLVALATKLANRQDAVDVKSQKPEEGKKVGVAAEELLQKYKALVLKAKQESTANGKKLDAVRKELQVMAQQKSSLEDKIRTVTAQLAEEKQKHRLTASSLEQTSNLVSLEMADYERHASELTDKLAVKDASIGRLEKDVEQHLNSIKGLRSRIEELEKQNGESEERIEQLKTTSIKLRSELLDLQNAESDWNVRESALVARLETASQEVEASKLQVADASGNLRESQLSNRAMAEAHRKAIGILEGRAASLIEELDATRNDLNACRAEYEGYKIRVHSVLKQQKTKSTPVVEATSDSAATEERERLEKALQSARTRNQEMSARCEALVAENGALQEEHGNLLQRHNRLVANLGEQESSWRQRLEALQSELRSEQQEQVELGRQLRLQQEAHTVATERQDEAHRQEVEQLREQLQAQSLKLIRHKADAQDSAGTPGLRASSANHGQPRDDEPTMDASWSSERQEGEGSEFNESSFSPLQKLRLWSPTSAFTPLERLLNRDERNEGSSGTMSVNDVEKLENEMSIASKKIEHMAEILHESETTNARATEQIRLLKDEIRRLERNQEREKHMANMEYLKNVIVKFLALSSGDERERLVPVLTTLLRLSPEEEQRVFTAARGNSDAAGIVGSGWSNYLPLPLPRWPGT